jgi:hypothetical protein
MAFDWEEYLRVAEFLKGDQIVPIRSAKDRSSISRSYYAALMMARNFVKHTHPGADIGVSGALHRRLPRWLKEHPNESYRMVGEYLERLRRKREKADYEDANLPRLEDDAYDAACNSEIAIRTLKAL